jgi:DNA anti-recombination protein RmuC
MAGGPMPVTAKLSLKFYEKLGEDVANELVEWFNSVDATYRADLRELNELNFARFDAKLEQRVAQLDAKLEQRLAVLSADLRSEMDRRFTQVDARFETLEARLVQRLETRIGTVRQAVLRWMLASWSSMMLVLLGTLFAVLKSR